MDNARFLDLLDRLCRRPAMFTNAHTVESVSVFLTGYFIGVADGAPEGLEAAGYGGWMRWVEVRYGVFHPAWSWARILLHHHDDDRAVLDVLPSLFREFLADRDAYGDAGIEARHQERFRGRASAPGRTHTVDPG
ncbi:hypothetical protein ACFCV8_09100 [Streptomyces sp. NPDC056347]|uniref:hypothetical protein n=1 Tax=Streptomyces sp. NPDC056347 TaxID=3345790 RepID=UPI0035D7217A